jgi:acetylcholinesterase
MAPLYRTDHPKYQAIYDQLVEFAGCTSAPDTLECLRAVPYATLKAAVDTTPSSISSSGVDFTWGISIDGDLIEKTLRQYISEGCYARVPILGSQDDDEGT